MLTRISDDMRENNGTCRLTASKLMGDVQFLSFGVVKGYSRKRKIDKGFLT